MQSKMPAGRPTDFKTIFIEQGKKLAAAGATDMEIADFFGVTVRTIQRWRLTHPKFCRVLKAAKGQADAKVERSLFQRATGFEHDSVKIFCGKDGKITQVPFREYVVPDTTAGIFWLKNRDPENWRDRIEHTGPGGGAIQIVNDIIPRPKKEE